MVRLSWAQQREIEMGTRQARRQRQIERAHERYAGVLLAVGMPRKLRALTGAAEYGRLVAGKSETDWYDVEWREKIREFYIAAHQGSPAPTDKTVKKFVRGYIAWLRTEIYARKYV